MKNFKVSVRRKDSVEALTTPSEHDVELRKTIEGYKKKGLNLKEICERLNQHGVNNEEGTPWHYEELKEACHKLDIHH